MNEMDEVDVIKKFLNAKKALGDEDKKKKLIDLLKESIPSKRIEQVDIGLTKNDEFILLSVLLGNCEFITRFEETPYVNSGRYISPDILAAYRTDFLGVSGNAQRCFIEVKTCHKKKFRISKKDFDKRERFAEFFSLPLFFAINFTWNNLYVWTIYPASYVKSHGYKIRFPEDIKENYFDLVTANKWAYLEKPLKITKEYSKTKRGEIFHRAYGTLVKEIIEFDDKVKEIDIEKEGEYRKLWGLILSKACREEKVIENNSEKVVTVTETSTRFIPYYEMILYAIKQTEGLITNSSGIGELLLDISKNKYPFLQASYFEKLVDSLAYEGIGMKKIHLLPSSFFEKK